MAPGLAGICTLEVPSGQSAATNMIAGALFMPVAMATTGKGVFYAFSFSNLIGQSFISKSKSPLRFQNFLLRSDNLNLNISIKSNLVFLS